MDSTQKTGFLIPKKNKSCYSRNKLDSKRVAFMHILQSDVVARASYYEVWNEIDLFPNEMKCILQIKFAGSHKHVMKDSELERVFSELFSEKTKELPFQNIGVALNGNYIILAIYSIIDHLIDILSGFCEEKGLDYRIGISSPFNNVDYFSVVYSEAMEAAANGTDSSRINTYQKNLLSASTLPGGTADIFCLTVSQQLIDCLSADDVTQLSTIIPSFYQHLSTMDYSTAFNICIDVIKRVSAHFGLNTYEDFHIKYRFDLFGQEDKIFSAIRTTFVDNLFRIIAILKDTPDNTTKRIVIKVKNLVEHHYSNPNLTLFYIANTLYLSYNYLSSIFKQYTGTTFINHLTSVRMNNAIKMLLQGTYKISEIAEAVGYSSSSYFVTVFKRHFNTSPSEYRAQSSSPHDTTP